MASSFLATRTFATIRNIRLGFLVALFPFIAFSTKADILISDFGNFSLQNFPPMGISWSNGSDQYLQNAGFISIAPVNGGNPTGDGYFFAGMPGGTSLNLSGLNALSLNAQVDAGNSSSAVRVILYDGALTKVASAAFSVTNFGSSFSTQTQSLAFTGLGTVGSITYWRVEGDGISSNAFRFSFNNLSATTVPETSSYPICAAAFLVMWIVRREVRKRVN